MTDRKREVFAAALLIAPVAGTIISMILVDLSDRLHIKRVKKLYALIHNHDGRNIK
jgi:phosphate/sulfate permease